MILALPIADLRAADIVGVIADTNGAPVSGAQVSVQDLDGKTMASAVTDARGHYEVHGLPPASYNMVVRGQSGVAYLGSDGLTVNWGISKDAPPVAIARKGVTGESTASDSKRAISPMSVEEK